MSVRPGQLVVISGPSGSGKTSIIRELRKQPRVKVSTSVTTRPRRAGEVHGRDYAFVDRDAFVEMNEQGLFVETNDVFSNGHLYGSPRQELEEVLADADAVYIMEVDVVGAQSIRDAGYEGTYVFIAPPSLDVLEKRLRRRETDDEEAIRGRMARARDEIAIAEADDKTIIVINDDLCAATHQILETIGLAAGSR